MAIIASFALPHPPLIAHEVGKGREKVVEKTIESYKKVAKEIAKLKPETIVISSPHTVCYKDYFFVSTKPTMKGSFASFGASDVSFEEKIDIELANEIGLISKQKDFPAGEIDKEVELDHGTMVPLYFIRKEFSNFKIVVLGLSGFSLEKHFEFGKIVEKAINKVGRKVVFVASGDLSHRLQEDGPYGFIKEGPIYDEMIVKTLSRANFKKLLEYDDDLLDKAAECGHPSFTIMAGVFYNRNVKPRFFSHEDITGVGYGVWSFYPFDDYVYLAKKAIETYVKDNIKIDVPSDLPEEFMKEKKGVFVSIHKNGDLRGCIGTILPVRDSLALEIIENAIHAATEDPRFPTVTKEELGELEINVDVLTVPELIDSAEKLDPKKYGVIVQSGFKRGVLLLDLEGIDTVDKQVFIARQKADISEKEDVILQRFEVVRHF